MSEFGIPYMGSKSSICKKIIGLFPKAENFYDLFGGGFSITHSMLVHRSKDFKHFYFNEIRKGVCELVQDAINGKYSYDVFKSKWISREEFEAKKESDAYIKLCWSFGNNGKSYIFGKDIEEYKKSLHDAIVFGEFDDLSEKTLGLSKWKIDNICDRRLFLRYRIEYLRKKGLPEFLHKYISDDKLKKLKECDHHRRLQQLQQLEQLERLQQLERLERLQRLHFSNKSYDEIEIKPNSIIYCDPPYSGTAEYDNNSKFNHKKFLDWADAQENPVFISEYNISDKRFKLVKSIKKRSLLSSNKDKYLEKDEKVYINQSGFKLTSRK